MAKPALMGDLERAVMERLWSAPEPQTVRQVHAGLTGRHLAYTTIMTVLRRLATKHLVVQYRDDRAYRYAPAHSREDLVAELMLDALRQAADDSANRAAAILHFVELVGAEEACALRHALAKSESKQMSCAPVSASQTTGATGSQRQRVPSGMVAVTVVPDPPRDRMFSRPPTSSARSAIDSRP